MSEGAPGVDFGDLDEPAFGDRRTLLVNDGARHTIVPGVYLGASIDAEPDGNPTLNALGDDLTGTDDEDGVTYFYPLLPGHNAYFNVTASQDGWLDAWFDFNTNGYFVDPGEHVYSGPVPAGGFSTPAFMVPMTAVPLADAPVRVRYSLAGPLTVNGLVQDGEVEDYMVPMTGADYGDAPAPYPTLLASNGARHMISPGVYMGSVMDVENNGQPHGNALGDDNAFVDDEDGVVFNTPLDPTQSANVTIQVSQPGFIDAWIDFNDDGSWSPGEKIFNAAPVVAGPNTLYFVVPGTSSGAFVTFARFRYGLAGGLLPTGLANSGEVDDYEVNILADTATPVKDTPTKFALFDAVPNPFNPRTTISFALPAASHVELSVYDVSGRLVATLLDENRPAGTHRVEWDGRNRAGERVASGVYLYRIQAGGFTDTKRMVLLK
jgi:hypothetical protein